MTVTTAAVDSPRPSVRNKLPALIFIIFPRFFSNIAQHICLADYKSHPTCTRSPVGGLEIAGRLVAGPFVMAGMFVAGQLVMAGTAFILAQLLFAGVTIGNLWSGWTGLGVDE